MSPRNIPYYLIEVMTNARGLACLWQWDSIDGVWLVFYLVLKALKNVVIQLFLISEASNLFSFKHAILRKREIEHSLPPYY